VHVILGMRTGEQIVSQAELLKEVEKPAVEALVHLVGGAFFRFGADGDGCAVAIRSGDETHPASAQAVIAREDICWQVRTAQVAHVNFSISVRPRRCNKDKFRHAHLAYLMAVF